MLDRQFGSLSLKGSGYVDIVETDLKGLDLARLGLQRERSFTMI